MKAIKYITILTLCVIVLTSKAQDKKTEVEIGAGYGLSGLSGSIENGSLTPGMGYQLSLNGKYFFTSSLGAGIGAGYATCSSKAELSSYSANIPSVDDENESFGYRVTANGIKEEQNLSVLEIPIFLVYRKNFSEKLGFTGGIGLKFSVPLTATYNCNGGSIETKGYYDNYNVELYNLTNHGFGKMENISYSGDLTTTLGYSLFATTGITIPAGKIGINLGVYGSYGLNPILKPLTEQLMVYPGNYQSVTSICENIKLISGGLRIGIKF